MTQDRATWPRERSYREKSQSIDDGIAIACAVWMRAPGRMIHHKPALAVFPVCALVGSTISGCDRNDPASVSPARGGIPSNPTDSEPHDQWRRSQLGGDRTAVALPLSVLQHPRDPRTLIGLRVALERVPVHELARAGLWLGTSSSDRVFVAVTPADARKIPELDPGDLADVTGVVRGPPSAREAKARWNLSDELARQLDHEVVYVEAHSVEESDEARREVSRRPSNGSMRHAR